METKLETPTLHDFEKIRIYVDGKLEHDYDILGKIDRHYQDWFAERTEGHDFPSYPWTLLYDYASETFEDETHND